MLALVLCLLDVQSRPQDIIAWVKAVVVAEHATTALTALEQIYRIRKFADKAAFQAWRLPNNPAQEKR